MNKSRPVNLNLLTIRFPIPAIVSILHRISGLILFLLVPCALWLLNLSLTESGFAQIQQCFGTIWAKIIFWIILLPFCYHFVAGIRHLLSDVHVGDTLKGGRTSAWATFVVFIILALLAGVWLW